MRPQPDQRLDDLARRVRLDGIVDVRTAQTGAQGAELTGDDIGVDDQRRTVEMRSSG